MLFWCIFFGIKNKALSVFRKKIIQFEMNIIFAIFALI